MAAFAVIVALLALAPAAPCNAATLTVTPTQKVIAMLTDMKAKGEAQMDEEQKIFATYKEWADDESKKLGFEIKDGERMIEELVAFITKADSDVATLGEEIAALDAEINTLSGEKKAAEELRAQQHAEYLKTSEDYAESVDALERAIQVLASQNYDRAQAASLLQRVPGAARILAAFLQVQEGSHSLRGAAEHREPGAPEVAAYEFQSSGIVDLLKNLLAKFKAELAATEDAESNQAHEFSLVEIHLSNTIAKDTSDRDEKQVAKGKAAADSAKAQGELVEVRAEKAADEKLKADTEATFAVKNMAYDQNQAVRVQELAAIGKAIEILSSDAVSGSYAKHINLAQTASRGAASLIQLSRRTRRIGAKQQVTELLTKRARALNSRTLAELAALVASNPFAKVIGLIEDLIAKLKSEAAAEAEHKAWCDGQLHDNKLKREEKTAEVNKLRAEIEALDATITDQGNTIEKLVSEQAQLTQALQEATAIREQEHAENTQTIADAAAGLEAVGRAVAVLKEFYSAQASLLQRGAQVPELEAYKGMQSGNHGVIGMLEVIESDFARLKAETEASEQAAASEYNTFKTESEISKTQKHEAEVKLRLDKDQNEFVRGNTDKAREATQAELDAANAYYEELKPTCLVVQVSYEERVAKREQELEALKEAWEILDTKKAE